MVCLAKHSGQWQMECNRIKSKSQQLLYVMEKYYLIFKKRIYGNPTNFI